MMKDMRDTIGSGRRAIRHGLALLLATAIGVPALAQTTPAPAPAPAAAPQRNILAWPAPDTLSPEARAMVTMFGKVPAPNPWPPVAVQRQMTDAVQTSFGGQLEKRYGVRVESATIAGVPVRIVYPKGVTKLGSGPVLLNLHGGGFSLDSGSLTETVPIAALTGLPVVAVLYRMAPEHPFPAAVDDALAVYQALEKDHRADRIAVFGTSAGACLGAQLIARLTSLGRPMPAALGFFSGSADLSQSGDSESWMPLPNGGATLTAAVSDYVGKTPTSDPILSPLKGDISRFPPTLLLSSTRDILLSGTAIFARALTEKGVDARLVVFDGLPHAFWSYMDVPETGQANALIARFLKTRVEAKR
jgi:monoterpene epsilon-lactone hydrolase